MHALCQLKLLAKAAIHSVAAGDGAVHGAAAGGFGLEA